MDLPDGTLVEYVYDGVGRRIGRLVDGVRDRTWIYGGGLGPVAELDGSGALVQRYLYGRGGNVPDAIVTATATYRIVGDHLGSVRFVVDASTGVVIQELDYDVFGRVVADTNPGWQPFGFAGGMYDEMAGHVQFSARWYDAETGRWTQKDPILFGGGDPNLYAYVDGDPMNLGDPSGLSLGVAAGWEAWDIALNFYQQGREDVRQARYVRAAFNFRMAGDTLAAPYVGISGAVAAEQAAARALASQVTKASTCGTSIQKVGDQLNTVDDILANPKLLSGLKPQDVMLRIQGRIPEGWRLGTLGRGSQKGKGWVLRQYNIKGGEPTGRSIRWHPGGGHHGPGGYWRVTDFNTKSGIIR